MKTRTLFLLLAGLLLALWYFASRSGRKAEVQPRPNDPWVFRSVLDKQPRMITFALNENLWVAYSTDSCSLYKAWAGGAHFSGAVYDMNHGPQPESMGPGWFVNQFKTPWNVELNGKSERPQTDYKGHRYLKNGTAEIMYDLVLSDGKRIRINERPEYVERDRQSGFERVFTMENAPEGAKVILKANVASISDLSNIQTDGEWKVVKTNLTPNTKNLHAVEAEGELTLRNGKETRFKTMFLADPLIANPFDAARAAEAETSVAVSPGEKIMAKSDCRTCHNPVLQTVGPGYQQIAERYKNVPDNLEKLSQKVIKGGSGVWGQAAMSAHPDLMPADAKAMVSYILSLDEGADDGEGGGEGKDLASIPMGDWLKPDSKVEDKDMLPGVQIKLWQAKSEPTTLEKLDFSAAPVFEGLAGKIDAGYEDFGPFKEDFYLRCEGYIFLEKDDNVVFQLGSDDGSRMFINEQPIIVHDGLHGMNPKEAEVALRQGYHRIRLEYFQNGGGRGLQLKWARFGSPDFKIISESHFFHRKNDVGPGAAMMMASGSAVTPGDGVPLEDVHPAYTLTQARPDIFLPKVAGMDFLPDGRLLVSTWDALGAVYVVDGVQSGDPKKITVKRIAQGLAEPLGLKVVDGEIYVLQKQELTHLVDNNRDGVIDEYRCFAKGWRASANFHEFAFGLAYKDDYFYAALAIAINPGGASTRPQILDRGKVVKISRKDGSIEFIARGLRTPNGIGLGPDGEIFVADNQGDWLPSSKILHVTPGAFFNSFAVDSATVSQMPIKQPVVWLPQDDIGNSPTQPALIPEGPYQGQLAFGDVCYGGLQRAFLEKVNGEYQGAVMRFTQGLEGGTNRLIVGPDNALYVGMIGNPGNWGQIGKLWYGLQRLKFNGGSTFDILAVRAKTNGMEIEFTEPLREEQGWDPAHYTVKQWWYKPTVNYGGPKMDEEELSVRSATVSADRKKVFLEVAGIKPQHVVYIRLKNLFTSAENHEIWSTECWYTMNNIPQDNPGVAGVRPTWTPPEDNTLTEKEKAEGWQLLFDGKTISQFHNYGKTTIGKSWIIDQNSIHLDAKPNPAGHWQAADGGDILTAEDYGDFEMELDWRIGECGNSGIIYHVAEMPEKYGYPWMTGPEMQVLDNRCHPDTKFPTHRAGDLYDLVECKYVTVKPAGEWNHVRLVFRNGKVEHWLNHRKVVELQMFENGKPTEKWLELIAKSKFPKIPAPDFGLIQKGKICLQDHGDPVWYKNIKIRKL